MFVDLPEQQLRDYRSSQTDPTDFDTFWAGTLAEVRQHDLDLVARRAETPLATLDVWDLTFSGFGGQRIKAWLRVPRGVTAPLPTIVEFVGYGGGRGHATDNLLWASAGYAHVVMDTRGQGRTWGHGDTADDSAAGPQIPGMMTRGIQSRDTYYYRRVFSDAVRMVDAARQLDIVDADRLVAHGISQGGGITLAVAALVPDLSFVAARVPFLCDFPRATTITDADPYKEIGRYLATARGDREAVSETLSYFDGVNFAKRAVAPAYFSTALMDAVCPPSTVFAAFNAYAGQKQIVVWPFNGHEGGGIDDDLGVLTALAAHGLAPRA